MKNFSEKYGKFIAWGITAFAVLACGILFYFGLDYIGALFKAVGRFFSILSPFIYGLIIAYLLIPPMRYFENRWFKPLADKLYARNPKKKKNEKLPHTLALVMSELMLLIVLTALIYLIVPQLYESIETIVLNSPEYIKSVYDSIDKALMNHPDIGAYATNIFGTVSDGLTGWAENKVLPGMENIVTNITSGVYFILKLLYNLVIGIIVSVYILNNKSKCRGYAKKLLYCVFNANMSKKITNAVKFVDDIFMNFISGKLVDSAIIGVLLYFCCLILRMPYALLIAVIIGVLNIIPFFGMYIGAIPTGLLILIVDPVKCLIYVGLIIVLHIIDYNVIAPKILGDSIGINGFWVIFSIILFGGLFGFWGMILGVPVFVVIYTLLSNLINRGLEKQNLPDDVEAYMNLDYIDPETGKAVLRHEAELEDGEI